MDGMEAEEFGMEGTEAAGFKHSDSGHSQEVGCALLALYAIICTYVYGLFNGGYLIVILCSCLIS